MHYWAIEIFFMDFLMINNLAWISWSVLQRAVLKGARVWWSISAAMAHCQSIWKSWVCCEPSSEGLSPLRIKQLSGVMGSLLMWLYAWLRRIETFHAYSVVQDQHKYKFIIKHEAKAKIGYNRVELFNYGYRYQG